MKGEASGRLQAWSSPWPHSWEKLQEEQAQRSQGLGVQMGSLACLRNLHMEMWAKWAVPSLGQFPGGPPRSGAAGLWAARPQGHHSQRALPGVIQLWTDDADMQARVGHHSACSAWVIQLQAGDANVQAEPTGSENDGG